MTYTQKMFGPDDLPKLEMLLDRVWSAVTGPVNVVIEPARKKRSLTQNALFHMWCGELAKQINERNKGKKLPALDSQDMKDFLVVGCYGHIDRRIGNVKITRPRHTSRMDKGEMHHLLAWIEQWCAEKGLKITIPADSEYRKNSQ